MANEKRRLHHSRFPGSGDPLDFVLPVIRFLRDIAYRKSFPNLGEHLKRLNLTSCLLGRVVIAATRWSNALRAVVAWAWALA